MLVDCLGPKFKIGLDFNAKHQLGLQNQEPKEPGTTQANSFPQLELSCKRRIHLDWLGLDCAIFFSFQFLMLFFNSTFKFLHQLFHSSLCLMHNKDLSFSALNELRFQSVHNKVSEKPFRQGWHSGSTCFAIRCLLKLVASNPAKFNPDALF